MESPRYWVRLKVHLDTERVTSLVNVLAMHTLVLKQESSDGAYMVDLMPREKPEQFERTLNVWEGAGWIEWRKI